jgi:hypothetical protein
MLSGIYSECHIQALYAEVHYAEYRYAECRYAECRSAVITQFLESILLTCNSSNLECLIVTNNYILV